MPRRSTVRCVAPAATDPDGLSRARGRRALYPAIRHLRVRHPAGIRPAGRGGRRRRGRFGSQSRDAAWRAGGATARDLYKDAANASVRTVDAGEDPAEILAAWVAGQARSNCVTYPAVNPSNS